MAFSFPLAQPNPKNRSLGLLTHCFGKGILARKGKTPAELIGVLLNILLDECIVPHMYKFKKLLFTGVVFGASIFGTHFAISQESSDPTAAAAWSAGNASGVGNFLSYCVTCHGDLGNGDGVLADSLDVKPRASSDAEFMSSKTDEHLFTVIKNGGAAVGLTENMTPFDGLLSDEEITNIIAYLRQEICKCEYKN